MPYFITTLNLEDDGRGIYITRSRTVGFYNSFEKAEKAVENNYGDIYECGYYNYAVIENIEEGLYQYDFKGKWYRWNEDNDAFERCERPNRIEDSNFSSIG